MWRRGQGGEDSASEAGLTVPSGAPIGAGASTQAPRAGVKAGLGRTGPGSAHENRSGRCMAMDMAGGG